MEPKLVYWTAALANMGVIVVLALRGVAHRRRGAIDRHRRSMLAAGWLVLAFLASYAVKLAVLGREAMQLWSPTAVWVLRIHELCVLTMLVAGGAALWRGRSLSRTRNASLDPRDPPAPAALADGHRRLGTVAVAAALLGFLTAVLVLAGMYARAGG